MDARSRAFSLSSSESCSPPSNSSDLSISPTHAPNLAVSPAKRISKHELISDRIRAILEKKTELYNHLADGVGSSELAGRFLVDFQTKKQDEVQEAVLAAREDDDVHTVDADDDEW